jgi:hypothetical protein
MDTEWWTRTGDGRQSRHPGIPTAATTSWDAVWKRGRVEAAWAISNQDSSADKDTAKGPGLATAATRLLQGGTPPSNRRRGALLSSDDVGSSVERDGGRHPLWQGPL